jgi:3-oxoacyl-[acyl-carrier protein] reductase
MNPIASLVSLHGKVALVAGGGGAIGSAIAARLFEAGARVYSLDLPGHQGPAGAVSLFGDLTQPADIDRALAHIHEQSHRLDVVVHAAGITRDARVWKLSTEDWRAVLTVNLDSAFSLVHAAVPFVRQTGGGSIVLVSSINGQRGKVGLAAYSASKAGIDSLARTTAREVGSFGIRVNAIAPGWIHSPMTAAVPEEARKRALEESALGRFGEPDDIARAALFLAGEMGRHVTGQVIRVDGGQLIG